MTWRIYPTLQQPVDVPQADPSTNEAAYHQNWSEPVRFKRDPQANIALMASGLFFCPVTFGEIIYEDKWHFPWSEPVRQKPGLSAANQQTLAFQPNPYVSFGWDMPLSYPNALMRQKGGLAAYLQRATSMETPTQPPSSNLIQWFANLSEPQRQKIGLKSPLQQFYSGPPRLLPTPNVTAVMSATEINTDVALFAINVYDGSSSTTTGGRARVSIIENFVSGESPVSIQED